MSPLTLTEILRHGKHANAASTNNASDAQRNHKSSAAPPMQDSVQVIPAASLPPDAYEPSSKSKRNSQPQQNRQAAESNTSSAKQKDYRQEAEKIVAEEKANGERMPSYEVSNVVTAEWYGVLTNRASKLTSSLKRWVTEHSQTSTRLSRRLPDARLRSRSCASTSSTLAR